MQKTAAFMLALCLMSLAGCGHSEPPRATDSATASDAGARPGDRDALPPPEPEREPEPEPEPAAEFALDDKSWYALCGGEPVDLADVVQPIAKKMTAQKIPYTQNPSNEWRDCSGNFLRLSSYVASACPDQQANLIAPPGVRDYTPGGNNVGPGSVQARSSRDVAKWYHERGRFTPVYYDGVSRPRQRPAGLVKIRNLIRPGTVVWFSRGRPLSEHGIDALFERSELATHINHMGTVTKVHRDADGNVERYEIYHGRTRDKPGSVTKTHFWVWPDQYLAGGRKEYPSFGYWKQSLVGIATLVPTLTAAGT